MRGRRNDVVGMAGQGFPRTWDGPAGAAWRLKAPPHSTDTGEMHPAIPLAALGP